MRSGKRWGFIDTSGKIVIQPQFKSAFYFREGVGTAEVDSGYASIDTSGKVLAEGFDNVDFINDGRVPVSHRDKSGFLSIYGKVVIPSFTTT